MAIIIIMAIHKMGLFVCQADKEVCLVKRNFPFDKVWREHLRSNDEASQYSEYRSWWPIQVNDNNS